jgi:hypothetical protein
MSDPLLPPPNSKKRNLGERNPGSLPHFRFLKKRKIQEGVKIPLETTSLEKKRFILEFQVVYKIKFKRSSHE